MILSAALCAAILTGCKEVNETPMGANDSLFGTENGISDYSADMSGESVPVSSSALVTTSAVSSSSVVSSTISSSSVVSSIGSSSAAEAQTAPETVSQSSSDKSEVHTPTIEHKHSYSAKTVSPSCTENGYTIYTCSCGEEYIDDYVDAAGHSYTKSIIKATCENGGYTVYSCSQCGSEYTDDYTAASGHDWSEWKTVKSPTTSAEGERRSTCAGCGEVISETIPKLKGTSSSYTDKVIELVNAERAKSGLAPLAADNALSEYAQLRSTELTDNFAHRRPDGSSPLTYVLGLNGTHTAGENIAYGQRSPEEVMNSWMNSEGHRANILSSSFTMIGVGCYEENGTLYWTQIFAG